MHISFGRAIVDTITPQPSPISHDQLSCQKRNLMFPDSVRAKNPPQLIHQNHNQEILRCSSGWASQPGYQAMIPCVGVSWCRVNLKHRIPSKLPTAIELHARKKPTE